MWGARCRTGVCNGPDQENVRKDLVAVMGPATLYQSTDPDRSTLVNLELEPGLRKPDKVASRPSNLNLSGRRARWNSCWIFRALAQSTSEEFKVEPYGTAPSCEHSSSTAPTSNTCQQHTDALAKLLERS